MHKFILMFAILATLSMSSHVQAQRGGQRGEGGPRGGQRGGAEGGQRGQRPASPMMTALDANKDGQLSAEEIANAATALKTLDKNQDGVLDSSELTPTRGGQGGAQGGRSSQMVERIMARDTDGDGKVSQEEAGEQMGRIFGRMDADSDGFVTKSEIENMIQQFQGGGGRRGGGRGAGGGGGGGRGARGGGGGPSTQENRPGFDE